MSVNIKYVSSFFFFQNAPRTQSVGFLVALGGIYGAEEGGGRKRSNALLEEEEKLVAPSSEESRWFTVKTST